MAKGVEDTAFYRWSRLVALNEVGGDPDLFGVSPAEFHAYGRPRSPGDWPATMTTLSTHDTKRQEDVRARLAVLSECPERLGRQVAEWHGWRAGHRRAAPRPPSCSEPDLEYLLWQTLVGAWPIGRDAARRVPAQGHARGQDPDLLDGRRTRVRGGGARPGAAPCSATRS